MAHLSKLGDSRQGEVAVGVKSDLRSVVARCVGVGQRVSLLSGDEQLAALLEQNNCQVQVDPAHFEQLSEFRPTVVVAFDALAAADSSVMADLKKAVPRAELLLSFANAAASSQLLSRLCERDSEPGLAPAGVEDKLSVAGYAVVRREVVVELMPPTPLAPSTESALRRLFEQLNPIAACDRLVWKCQVDDSVRRRASPEEGRLSIIMVTQRLGLLERLRSLPRLPAESTEVVIIGEASLAAVIDDVSLKPWARHLKLVHAVKDSSSQSAALNAGLASATGQWIVFAEDGGLAGLWPQLLQALKTGARAWSVLAPEPVDRQQPLDVWVESPSATRVAWCIDRLRLGAFPLQFSEEAKVADAVLFVRLLSLFEPEVVVSPKLAMSGAAATLSEVLTLTAARPLQHLVPLRVNGSPQPTVRTLLSARMDEAGLGRWFNAAQRFEQRVTRAALRALLATSPSSTNSQVADANKLRPPDERPITKGEAP
jgi:hypothetical protein